KPARVCAMSSTPVSGRATSTSRATTSMRGLPMTNRTTALSSRPSTQSRSGFMTTPWTVAQSLSGIAERGLDLLQVGGDPLLVERAAVVDRVLPGIVTRGLVLLAAALDIQLGQRCQCVLSGASRHAGGGHQCRYAGGGTAVDQPGHIEAAVEAGAGLADFHDPSPQSGRRSELCSRSFLWPGFASRARAYRKYKTRVGGPCGGYRLAIFSRCSTSLARACSASASLARSFSRTS